MTRKLYKRDVKCSVNVKKYETQKRAKALILHENIQLMKKLFSLTLMLLLGASAIFAQGNASKGNYTGKGGTPHEVIKGNNMTISYGRPLKKGRDIFGGLVPNGQVWRTGADEATEITFDKGCVIGGKQISAGTYTLFTIPGKEWTIILNKELKQWGAFKYDKSKDVLQTVVQPTPSDKLIEQFTIVIKDDGIMLAWDKTTVFLPIKF